MNEFRFKRNNLEGKFSKSEKRDILIDQFNLLLENQDKLINKKQRSKLLKLRGQIVEEVLSQQNTDNSEQFDLEIIKKEINSEFQKYLEPKSKKKKNKEKTKERGREHKFSKMQKKSLLKKSGGVCTACHNSGDMAGGRHSNPLEPHHIIPVNKGGETTIENGAMLCRGCHIKVHNLATKPMAEKKSKITKSQKKEFGRQKAELVKNVD